MEGSEVFGPDGRFVRAALHYFRQLLGLAPSLAPFAAILCLVAAARAQTVISTIPVGGDLFGVEVNPTTDRVYVTNRVYVASQATYTISVIDGSTGKVIGAPIPVGADPLAMAVNSTTNRIYVANLTDNTISVIDGSNNTVIGAPIPVGRRPFGVAVNSTTNLVYVTNGNNVFVIDGSRNTVVGSIPVGNSEGVAVNPITNRVYVTSGGGTVSVIDGNTNTVTGTPIFVGSNPQRLDVNPTTNRVYVANFFDNTVSVIDANTDTVIGAAIPVGTFPIAVTVNPTTDRVYVVNRDDNTVSVIDGSTNTVSGAPISVGAFANGVAVNPSTNRVYVTSGNDSTLSVIDGSTPTPTQPSPRCSPDQAAVEIGGLIDGLSHAIGFLNEGSVADLAASLKSHRDCLDVQFFTALGSEHILQSARLLADTADLEFFDDAVALATLDSDWPGWLSDQLVSPDRDQDAARLLLAYPPPTNPGSGDARFGAGFLVAAAKALVLDCGSDEAQWPLVLNAVASNYEAAQQFLLLHGTNDRALAVTGVLTCSEGGISGLALLPRINSSSAQAYVRLLKVATAGVGRSDDAAVGLYTAVSQLVLNEPLAEKKVGQVCALSVAACPLFGQTLHLVYTVSDVVEPVWNGLAEIAADPAHIEDFVPGYNSRWDEQRQRNFLLGVLANKTAENILIEGHGAASMTLEWSQGRGHFQSSGDRLVKTLSDATDRTGLRAGFIAGSMGRLAVCNGAAVDEKIAKVLDTGGIWAAAAGGPEGFVAGRAFGVTVAMLTPQLTKVAGVDRKYTLKAIGDSNTFKMQTKEQARKNIVVLLLHDHPEMFANGKYGETEIDKITGGQSPTSGALSHPEYFNDGYAGVTAGIMGAWTDHFVSLFDLTFPTIDESGKPVC